MVRVFLTRFIQFNGTLNKFSYVAEKEVEDTKDNTGKASSSCGLIFAYPDTVNNVQGEHILMKKLSNFVIEIFEAAYDIYAFVFAHCKNLGGNPLDSLHF
jgi:hypothetical protein